MALTKEQRKKIAATTMAGGGPQAKDRRKRTKVSDALAPEVGVITLGGRQFTPSALTFGDAKRIEARFGHVQELLDQVSVFGLDAVGFLIWLSLRRSAPGITQEELEDLLPANQLDVIDILARVMQASGLKLEQAEGNDPAPTASP